MKLEFINKVSHWEGEGVWLTITSVVLQEGGCCNKYSGGPFMMVGYMKGKYYDT